MTKKYIPENYLSYGKQWITDEDIQAVNAVLTSDYLTQGPKVAEFEQAICDYTGAKYCVAVANGTAALHIAVTALDIPVGGEGITTPITFSASANCMVYNQLVPRFADINPKTHNIDPENISSLLNEKTKLLIPVHFAGQAVQMNQVQKIAKENGLYVIEDAAHAIGSQYADGSYVGNCKYSDMTIFSFHPVKTITTGEGGAITTNSKELYERLMMLRSHGITKAPEKLRENPGPWYYEMQMLGYNYRITDLQSALGISQFKRLEEFKARRREIVAVYNEAFQGLDWITTPYELEGLSSCFHLYILIIDFEKIGKSRKQVMEGLYVQKIGTQVHYIPVNTLPYHAERNTDECPNAVSYYEKCLSIPLYPMMSAMDVEYVIKQIHSLSN